MKHLVRLTGVIAATALAVGTISTAPADAAKPATSKSAARAAAWLVAQLVDDLVPSSYGGANYGASADTAASLQAIGRTAQAGAVASALATNIDSYISGAALGDSADSIYAGSTAKAIVAFQAVGTDPTTVNGENLVTKLEGTVQPSGRIQDTSNYGDYGNVLGQSFAVRALTDAKSASATKATSFLITQQCKGGWFREYFSNTVDATTYVETNYDTACNADDTAKPYVDATAYAVIALEGQHSKAARASAAKAVAWLLKVQAKSGGFASTESNGKANANSTGLAAQALEAAGKTGAATKAATWLVHHQVPVCKGTLASAAGAIAYDDKALADARDKGWSAASDQWLVGASQVIPALVYAPKAKTTITC